ncbi:hypothetical protein BBP40_007829 [Aspergillus hancockii]|nr:hypothetical protein BBP40_007829 [Aspergillus hancockii]
MAPQLAWLGLGNMGRVWNGQNLAAKGSLAAPLIIYNQTAARAHDFLSKNPNTVAATTVQEAVTKADIIFTCVGDDAAIKDLINGSIATGNVTNKLFVDCSTFVASPVFGAPAMAEAGQVICVLDDPQGAVERVKPYTTGVIAKSFMDFSNQAPSKVSPLKILGNMFVISIFEAIAEGLVVAEKSGLGTDSLHQFLRLFSRGLMWLIRTECGRGMELADRYMAQGDLAGIYGAVREELGLKFENDALNG